MNKAARLIDDAEPEFDLQDADVSGAGLSAVKSPPIKCILMDDNAIDRQQIRRIAKKSRHDINLVETASIHETRERLAHQQADILIADYRVPDGNGIHFAADVLRGGDSAPQVIVVTGDTDRNSTIEAIRAGAADYLPKSDITLELFDTAIENAMRARGRVTAPDEMLRDQAVLELKNLRKLSLRNSSKVKASVLPLIALGWQISQGKMITGEKREELGQDVQELAKRIPNLLDELVITAACGSESTGDDVSDFTMIVRDIIGNDDLQLDQNDLKITCSKLPTLKVCPKRSRFLIEALINAAVQFCPLGQSPEIAMGSAKDPDGNPIIWVRDNGVPLEVRRNALGSQMIHFSGDTKIGDPFIWSMCQSLAEMLGASLKIRQTKDDLTTVMVRFNKSALA